SATLAFGLLAHASLGICEDVVSSKRFGVALAAARLRPGDHVVVVGDYETANSIGFYEPLPLEVVDGQAPSLEYGLSEPDAPRMVRTRSEVEALWRGEGRTCLIGAPDRLKGLLPTPPVELARSFDRALVCNRYGSSGVNLSRSTP